MPQEQEIKHTVLDHICGGERWYSSGRANFHTDRFDIHVRFCGTDRAGSPRYKFNINPNTLSADYEVWICGNAETYYTIPIQLMHQIYDDPEGYVDSWHPNIRAVSVDVSTHTVTYATGGRKIDMTSYLRRTL